MSKSFNLTHRHRPDTSFTLWIDDLFIRILEVLHIDVSGVSQEELETFLGTLSVLKPEITVHIALPCSFVNYMLRYE